MRKLMFVLALAACGNGNASDCARDPSLPGCSPPPTCTAAFDCHLAADDACLIDTCTDGVCGVFDTCASTTSGELVIFVNANDSMFLGGVYDDGDGYGASLDAEEADLAAISIGTCIEEDREGVDFEDSRKSMGNVQLVRGGTTLLDLPPTELFAYEEIIDPGVIALGDTLDVITTGSETVDPNTLPGFLRVPAARPVLDGRDANGVLALTETITFEPLAVDHMLFRFNFDEGAVVTTFVCAANPGSGTFTLDPTTFGRLPPSASITMSVFNRGFAPISTADGVARSLRGTVQASLNLTYQKPE